MKRRQFLKKASAVISLPVLLNGMGVSALKASSLANLINFNNNKVLVLIQLNGGNDGLNTFLPLDQYDRLANVRSNLIIPENRLLVATDNVGFHPEISGLKNLYDDARMGIVQSVGYPDQNRSHFRSTDIWTSGSSASEFVDTGWLGRYFQSDHPAFPSDYPNEDFPDPLAITMGNIVSQTCQGLSSNFSMALKDPSSLSNLETGVGSEVSDTPYGHELTFLRESIAQTNAYGEVVTAAANAGNTLANYPNNNELAKQLRNVAQLISGGLKTKIYVVSLGGFDTHANQVSNGDPTAGVHAFLLKTLSEAMAAFQKDLQLLNLEERVISMTFSEFGRRIRSNDSFGTDHGTAAPLMLFGSCVNPQILGDNPTISSSVDYEEGVPMQYDFRDVYGSVLTEWFETPASKVRELLYEDFTVLPILSPCRTTAVATVLPDLKANVFPNPFHDIVNISFETKGEWVRLEVFNALGSKIHTLVNKKLSAGQHHFSYHGKDLPAGNYFCRLQIGHRVKTLSVVKG